MASSLNIIGNTNFLPESVQRIADLPFGAERLRPQVAEPRYIENQTGRPKLEDNRVIIKVPAYYLKTATVGPNNELGIENIGGIIFPYSPQITFDAKAEYSAVNPTHGNYTQYFYQNSNVTSMSITGKFTVQNERDAIIYVSTIHLIKSLMKMQFGTDPIPGAPPPICRLNAYGPYMLKNVPIAITSLRIDYPTEVDYFTTGKLQTGIHGQNSVPVVSNIAITCIPVYSRQEMQDFSVKDYLENHKSKSHYI